MSTEPIAWGIQLPIQSQSTRFVRPWETTAGPAELVTVARAADAAGAAYVGVCDHIAIPAEQVPTMGGVWYDTIATLAWLAGQTERVGLLSHVAVLAYRHPAVTAKAWSTLDLLSGGRAILGVGAGHVAGEFELLGVDHRRRGQLLDHALAQVRQALRDGELDGAVIAPRSPRPDGPPIWVGGSSRAAIARAARLGDGWLPQGPPEMGMRAALDLLRSERGDRGPMAIGGFAAAPTLDAPVDDAAAPLRRARELGVTHLQVQFRADSVSHYVEQLARFGAEVWPAVLA